MLHWRGKASQLSSETRAYLAGLFDGEGCVLVYQYESLLFGASIVNTNFEVLHFVQETTDSGKITLVKKRQNHHKQSYVWAVRGNAALEFFRAIEPFLIVKRAQVAAAIYLRTEANPLDFPRLVELIRCDKKTG